MSAKTKPYHILDDIECTLGERKTTLSVREFAALTGAHYQTIWKAVATGEIPAAQSGKFGRYRIHYTQLAMWQGTRHV